MYNQTTLNVENFTTTVKFERLPSGHLIIPVLIGEKEHTFLLDTGTPNIISKELAEELKLKHVYHKKYLDSQNNKLELSLAELEEVTIGGIRFEQTATTIHDFDNSPPTIRCLNIAGVIGANLMKRAIWTFDFDKNEITISDNFISKAKASEMIKFKTGYSGTPKIDVQINGISDGKAYIDFGAIGFYKSSDKTFSKLCKPSVVHKCKITSGFGSLASGAFGYEKPDSSYLALVHNFSIGDETKVNLENQLISLSDHSDKLIGLEFFENFTTTIDWLNNRLILTDKDEKSGSSNYDSFGFKVLFDNGKLHIGFVYNNSPAEQAGLRIGDRIISVNDFDFQNSSEATFCEFLNSKTLEISEVLNVVILRRNQPTSILLKKRDLLAKAN